MLYWFLLFVFALVFCIVIVCWFIACLDLCVLFSFACCWVGCCCGVRC